MLVSQPMRRDSEGRSLWQTLMSIEAVVGDQGFLVSGFKRVAIVFPTAARPTEVAARVGGGWREGSG